MKASSFITSTLLLQLVALIGGTRLEAAIPGPEAGTAGPKTPKIILVVMLDDADYNDFGFNSADAITPNIDALAQDGMVLSQYYSAGPICSPTRLSVLTGDNPIHYGLNHLWPDIAPSHQEKLKKYHWGMRGIPAYEETLGQSLKDSGYRTFHIGKWHVGNSQEKFRPAAKGFDEYAIMKAKPYEGVLNVESEKGYHQTAPQKWRPSYQADRIIEYIEKNKAANNVFVNWWPIEPHTPLYVPPTFDNACCNFDLETDRGMLLSMMHGFDHELGRVIEHLKAKGLYNDTLIIVTSDNGGLVSAVSPRRTFKGGKGGLYEGGIRVPFVAVWPNTIPKGTKKNRFVTSMDLYPTIMGLIGQTLPKHTDGIDLSAVLLGQQASPRATPVFFQTRIVSMRTYDTEHFEDEYALRAGCHKIIKKGMHKYDSRIEKIQLWLEQRMKADRADSTATFSLYNVCSDPAEQNDLADTDAELFQRLKNSLLAQRLAVSQYARHESVTGPIGVKHDDRLDIHHDDISIYATIQPVDAAGVYNIYRRGQGINFRYDANNGKLIASVLGIADTTLSPKTEKVVLEAEYPKDDKPHEVAFVIRGYLRGEATLSLYIDGLEKTRIEGPQDSTDPGDSVYAVISEDKPATLGAHGLNLTDYRIYLTAIKPDEIVNMRHAEQRKRSNR